MATASMLKKESHIVIVRAIILTRMPIRNETAAWAAIILVTPCKCFPTKILRNASADPISETTLILKNIR